MKTNQKLRKPSHTLYCSGCGVKKENCGGESVKILCWKCVILSQRPNAKIIE
jgi:hypothetical protein